MNKNKFNPEQLGAITYTNKPLLIIAGAGTGKTTVITERIKYLILEKDIKPHQVLALTFTEKAAGEMEERVDKIMPYGYTQMWIETFHSFCDQILRLEAINIGLDPNYTLMTQAESVLFLRKNIFNLKLDYFRPLGNPAKFLEALLEHFSHLKDEDITVEEYLEYAKKISNSNLEKMEPPRVNPLYQVKRPGGGEHPVPENQFSHGQVRGSLGTGIEKDKTAELATAYKMYEQLKTKEGKMDFADLISNTLLLFEKRPDVLKKYQNQFKYILVDEFQDTNYAQNKLAIALSGQDKNITVVADDDQAIYRWRGAAISNVLQFKKNFPGAKIITLTKNYRSTQEILDSAYKLIQNNNPDRLEIIEKINKRLTAERKLKGEKIELIHTNRLEEETEQIAKKILHLTKTGKHKFKDIAILVRANNHSAPIIQALQRFSIPYQFLGPGQLFKQEEIKDLIAYLKALCDPHDSVSLFRVLAMKIFEISGLEISYLLSFAKKNNISLFETLPKTDSIFIKNETKKKLKDIHDMIARHLESAKKQTAGQILYYFLTDSGLYKKLLESKTQKDENISQNIAKFFDKLKTFELEHENANIYSVVDWIDLMMQLGESPLAANMDWKDANSINILTVHSSKGLEFPVVFLVNLVADRFPTREKKEKIPLPDDLIKEEALTNNDYHLKEERRLFYVGMTRARDQLILTCANLYGEGKREKKISPFVVETLGKQILSSENKQEVNQLSLLEAVKGFDKQENLTDSENEKSRSTQPKLTYISFSQIQTFDICPLHFKARYILNIPSRPSASLSFGTTIHSTLRDFYKILQEKKLPSEKDFLDLLSKNWASQGYENKQHENEMFERGKTVIKKYYKDYFLPQNVPQTLELPFSFFLDNNVKVVGKIDRIDKLPDNKIEIFDYKTGRESNSKNSYQLQLGIYGLAATKVNHEVFAKKKPEDIKLTLFYLETGEKITHIPKKEELGEIESMIKDKIEEIQSSDFACSGGMLCANCEYKMLCQTS